VVVPPGVVLRPPADEPDVDVLVAMDRLEVPPAGVNIGCVEPELRKLGEAVD
jgi:hypothetical protein